MNNVPDEAFIQNLKKINKGIQNIHVIENFLSQDECLVIYNESKKDIYNKNVTGQWANRLSDPNKTSNDVKNILKSAHIKILEIAKNFYNVDLEFISFDEGQSIVKWPTGSSMDEHIDDFSTFHNHIASLLYLNDDYEGGEIRFVDYDFTIKPKSGTLILFPGNKYYSHEVLKVKTGERYVSPLWFKFSNSSFSGNGQALGLSDIRDWKNIDWENNIEEWRKK